MTLFDAAYELEELAAGRPADPGRLRRGLRALAPYLKQANCDPRLQDASFLLEKFLLSSITLDRSTTGLARANDLAAAVRNATWQKRPLF